MPKNVPSEETIRRWNHAYIGAVRELARAQAKADRIREQMERHGVEPPPVYVADIAELYGDDPDGMIAFEREAKEKAVRIFEEIEKALWEKLRTFKLPDKPEEKGDESDGSHER